MMLHTLRRAGENFVLNIIWYRVHDNTIEWIDTHSSSIHVNYVLFLFPVFAFYL